MDEAPKPVLQGDRRLLPPLGQPAIRPDVTIFDETTVYELGWLHADLKSVSSPVGKPNGIVSRRYAYTAGVGVGPLLVLGSLLPWAWVEAECFGTYLGKPPLCADGASAAGIALTVMSLWTLFRHRSSRLTDAGLGLAAAIATAATGLALIHYVRIGNGLPTIDTLYFEPGLILSAAVSLCYGLGAVLVLPRRPSWH